MSVSLSTVFNGYQSFLVNGLPNSGGYMYTYLAGTTTPAATYTTSSGSVANANPIPLSAGGTPPNPIWLTDGIAYKLVVVDENFNPIPNMSFDNVLGSGSLASVLVGPSGSSTIGFRQSIGAVQRTVESKLRDFVNANDYATLTAAFAAADTVFVTSPNYAVGASTTIAKGKKLIILAGGSLSITGAMTINGEFSAPIKQVFFGSGTVTGIREVYPEWWGALGNGTGDDQPALQAAHSCIRASSASAGGSPTIYLTGSQYSVATTFAITPVVGQKMSVIGLGRNSCSIVPASGFPALPVMQVNGLAVGASSVDFCLQGFGIVPGSAGVGAATIGLQVGSTDAATILQGTQCSLIDNLFFFGFPKNIYVVHARLIDWSRIGSWNDVTTTQNSCLYITQNGGFTGDMKFDTCQFVGNTTNANSTAISIVSGGGSFIGGGYTISGVRFTNCTIYQAAKQAFISASGSSLINDIWFSDSTQFDGGGTNALYVGCDNVGSVVRNVNVTGCYFAGNITDDIVTLLGFGGALIDCSIVGNFFNGGSKRSIALFRNAGTMSGHMIVNNKITDNNNTTGPVIETGGQVLNFQIRGNNANKLSAAGFMTFIRINSPAAQFIVTNNNAGTIATGSPVDDLSGAVTKVVTSNI